MYFDYHYDDASLIKFSHVGIFDNLQVKTADGTFPLIQLGQVVQKNPQLVVINLTASPQVGSILL